jgi:hypothetical protein
MIPANRKAEVYRMTGSFSEKLRKLREEKGLSQKQLGKLVFLTAYPDYAIDAWDTGASSNR